MQLTKIGGFEQLIWGWKHPVESIFQVVSGSAVNGRVSKTVNFKEYNLWLGATERYEARWRNTGQREIRRGRM